MGFGAPLPWTLVHVDADLASGRGPFADPAHKEYALWNEAFAPVLAVVSLDAGDAPSFMRAAASFVNDRVWGTLSCTVLSPVDGARVASGDLDALLARLRYGTVALNTWSALCYALECCSWGAFPGECLDAVASGIGVVQNCLLFDDVQKSVVRTPFVSSTHNGCERRPLDKATARMVIELILGANEVPDESRL